MVLHWKLKVGSKTYNIGNFKDKAESEEAARELYYALAGLALASPLPPPIPAYGLLAGAAIGRVVSKYKEKHRLRSKG